MWGHVLFPCCGKYLLFFISIVGCKKKFWQQPWIPWWLKKGYVLGFAEKKNMLGQSFLESIQNGGLQGDKSQIPNPEKRSNKFQFCMPLPNGQIFIATSKQHHVTISGCGCKWPWSYPNIAWQKTSSPKAIWSILSKPGRPKSRVGGVSVGDLVWKKAQWWTSDKNIQNEN